MKLKFTSLLNSVILLLVVLLVVSCDSTKDGVGDNKYDATKSAPAGYCSNTLSTSLGSTSECTMSAAVSMPVKFLTQKGSHITGVRVGIMGEATNCVMFIKHSVDGESIVEKSFTVIPGAWTYIALDEPLKVTGEEDYYIGYNITGAGYLLGYQSASGYSTHDYVALNGNWSSLTDNGIKGKLSIQAMMVGGDYSNITPQNDLAIISITAPRYAKVNSAEKLSCVIINNGVNSVGSAEFTYSYAGSTQTVTLSDINLMGGATYLYELPISTAPSTAQKTSLTCSISSLSDDVSNNNEMSQSQLVYDQSYPRTILFEQFTGQTCPNCPQGSQYITSVMENYPGRYIRVLHHVGYNLDNLTIDASKPLTALYNSNSTYAPAFSLDRTQIIGTSPVMGVSSLNATMVDEMLAAPSFASVNISRTFDTSTRELSVTVSGNVLSTVKAPRLSVYLLQNGIVASQAGASSDYIHNNTIRASLATDNWGDVITPDENGDYTKTYTYTLPAEIGTFTCVPTDMDIVAFVTEHGSTVLDRQVLNAATISLVATAPLASARAYDDFSGVAPILHSVSDVCYSNH